MLKELIGYFNGIKKTQAEMKVALHEIKESLQGTNSGVDEAENQINDLEHKEEKNMQSELPEEKRIQKTKDRLRSLWDNFKYTNIQLIEVLEGEEKEQEIGNLFEKNNERKLTYFGGGNRHINPGSTESPKQGGCKENHTTTHHN